jgi:hypothetical protein
MTSRIFTPLATEKYDSRPITPEEEDLDEEQLQFQAVVERMRLLKKHI